MVIAMTNRNLFPLIATLLLFASASSAAPLEIYFIGVDNGSNSDFDHEGQADDHYYWQNGDYSGLGTGGANWAGGMEPFSDGGGPLGFDRALTTSDSTNYVYFQVPSNAALSTAVFGYTFDMVQANGTHDIEYGMNGNVFDTRTNFGNGTVAGTFTGTDVGVMAGSNYVQMEKTDSGGWTQFDFLRLTVTAPDLNGDGTDLSIDFGEVSVGSPASTLFTLENTGSMGSFLDITGASLGGPDAGLFDVPTSPVGANLVAGAGSQDFVLDFLGASFTGDVEALLVIDYLDENGLDRSITFDISAVSTPEPASIAIWSLIGLGLAGFGFYRVRRKQ